MSNNMIRLSISEAAKLFGVSTKTIQRALTSNELRYIVVKGRYKISFESLVKWSQGKNRIKSKTERQGIGQFVDRWKINNRLYSPNPQSLDQDKDKSDHNQAL